MTGETDAIIRGVSVLESLLADIDEATDKRARTDIITGLRRDDESFEAVAGAAKIRGRQIYSLIDQIGAVRGMAVGARALASEVSARVQELEAEDRRQDFTAHDREDGCPLSEVIDHEVPELEIPVGWVLQQDGIYVEKTGHDGAIELHRVTYAPVLITGVLTSIDDGSERVCVEWRRGDKTWHRSIMRRSRVRDARAIVRACDDGLDVSSVTARQVVAWLSAFEGVNGTRLPHALSTTKLGWQGPAGKYGYLVGAPIADDSDPPTRWGRNSVHLEATEGIAQIAGAFHPAGTMEGWKRVVEPALQYPIVTLGLYASLCAPFLGVIPGAPSPAIDWSGVTSRGKTTTLRLAASAWGSPELIGTWNAKPTAIERRAGLCSDVPIWLDDTRQAINPSIVEDTIYQISEGSGRERGSIEGLRKTVRWRTVLLSTGEAPITSFGQGGGARARALCLRKPPFGDLIDAEVVDRLREGCAQEYGHAGPMVGAWLETHRQRWPEIVGIYEERKNHYAEGRAAVGARMSAILALLEAGAFAAHEILGLPRPEIDPMEAALEALEEAEDDSDRPGAALHAVIEWAIAHPTDLYGRHIVDRDGTPKVPVRGWAGAWRPGENWNHIALLPRALERILRHQGFRNPEEILPAWKERGWLKSRERGRTWPVMIDGSRPWCVVILRQAVDEIYGKADDDDVLD